MSRRGNCWDDAPQESFFGHMKDELHLKECDSYENVCKELDNYFDYYNNDTFAPIPWAAKQYNRMATRSIIKD